MSGSKDCGLHSLLCATLVALINHDVVYSNRKGGGMYVCVQVGMRVGGLLIKGSERTRITIIWFHVPCKICGTIPQL